MSQACVGSACDAGAESYHEAAIAVCLARHGRTHDDRDLDRAAWHAMRTRELDHAERLAWLLMRGPLFGNAQQVLSYVSHVRGQWAEAWSHAVIAYAAHMLIGDQLGLAIDAKLLSDAARQGGYFTEALRAGDEAMRFAHAQPDAHLEVNATIALSDALRLLGDPDAAIDALTIAFPVARETCDKAWLKLKLGLARGDAGQLDRARQELDEATQFNEICQAAMIKAAITSNEAWLLRHIDPAGARRRIDAVIHDEGEASDVLLLRGYLAADRGALADARRDLAHAEQLDPPDADWPWMIAQARAELAELRGGVLGPVLAEFHYRRAIAMVAALRAPARTRSAYLVASHRGPYDGLIALLARHGRWRAALAVVLELDASDMLRATADAVTRREPITIAGPLAPSAPSPVHASVDAVLDAWRTRDLVIVIAPSPREIGAGGEHGYRIRIADGDVTGEDIGPAAEARQLAERLYREPGDAAAARALGVRMIPPGAEHERLHVLAIGALGRAPLAALRDADGALVLARRPLVRVLGLESTGAESTGRGPMVVIADPRGDLESAASEGAAVAATLGPSAQLAGSGTHLPATLGLLWTARDAELLHVASHVAERGRWRALKLRDGDVEPADIVNGRLAPRIAVLAGCGSAAARDGEGWGSLASALLTAGTAVVIATDRSVSDVAALWLMKAFYAQPDWREEPERALARAQVAFQASAQASSDDPAQRQAWAAFSVLRRPPVVAQP